MKRILKDHTACILPRKDPCTYFMCEDGALCSCERWEVKHVIIPRLLARTSGAKVRFKPAIHAPNNMTVDTVS